MLRSKPLQRGGPLKRGKPLAKVGAVAKRKAPGAAKYRKLVLERDGNRCRFPHYKVWIGGQAVPCTGHLDVHHPTGRSVNDQDPANGITLCRAGHQWVEHNIAAARKLGLYGPAGARCVNGLVVR